MGARARALGLEVWLPLALLLAWWLLSASSTSPFFPPLSQILARTWELWVFDHAVSDLLPSLVNLLVGFAVAVVVGVAAGTVLGARPALLDAVEPELELLRAVPAVALVPVAILAIGLGDDMRVTIIAFGALWPVLLNTVAGVRSLDPVARDVADAFALGARDRLLLVRLPAALPQILAGARTSLSIAVVLVLVSEYNGASRGVGFFILAAQRNFAITDMWTGMIVLGVTGYVLNLGFRLLERRLLHWHPAQRAARPSAARPPAAARRARPAPATAPALAGQPGGGAA